VEPGNSRRAENIRHFIGNLIRGTESGGLVWQETADEETFRLLLDAGNIHVRRIRPRSKGTVPVPPPVYEVIFFNQNNTPVDTWQPTDEQDLRQLFELYEKAYTSALNPTGVLKRLEQEVLRRSG
jgi:hypothetical protein